MGKRITGQNPVWVSRVGRYGRGGHISCQHSARKAVTRCIADPPEEEMKTELKYRNIADGDMPRVS